MAENKSSAGRLPDWAGTSSYNKGVNLDPGPFIGIIKNNSDPARAGRLAVWVPAIGGDEEDPDKWYVVRYASPFLGTTLGSSSDINDSFVSSKQTYGFWAVPPDIGNKVLITFVQGDPNQGYWFACVASTPTQHMVPSISRPFGNTKKYDSNFGTNGFGKISDKILLDASFGGQSRITPESFLPTSELTVQNATVDQSPEFYTLPRVVHTYQANIVIEQGLDKDPIRGTITSSSQRETPSQVIGLSSPGRTVPDTAEFPNLESLLDGGSLPISVVQNFPIRKGGHSVVLDDGDVYGQNNLVRIRSSGGHQILMHDTANVIYISNSLGTSWVELTPDGSINIFSGANISVRAQQDLNFHADNNINITSGNIKISAENYFINQTRSYQVTAIENYSLNAGNIGVKSDTTLLMQSITGGWQTSADLVLKGRKIFLNTTTPASPLVNLPLEVYQHANVEYDKSSHVWKKSTTTFESLSPFAPTHEPWARQTGKYKKIGGTIVPPMPQTPGSI